MKLLDSFPARILAALGWAGVLFFLSSQPVLPSPPVAFSQIDKLEHFTAYGLLALLAGRAFLPWLRKRKPRLPRWQGYALLALIVFLYGLSDEMHQAFVPPRECDTWDAVADGSAGVVVAVVLNASQRVARWLGVE